MTGDLGDFLGEPTLPVLMVLVHAIRQQAGRQAVAS